MREKGKAAAGVWQLPPVECQLLANSNQVHCWNSSTPGVAENDGKSRFPHGLMPLVTSIRRLRSGDSRNTEKSAGSQV